MDSVIIKKEEDSEQDDSGFDDTDLEEGWLEEEDGVEYYADAGFRIQQVKAPQIVQRSLGQLYAASHEKYMILNPEYQRDIVWDENRASTLIASIFQGYFIPPIIFNVISRYEADSDNHNKKVLRHYRVCIDGKQRLTSVQKFMDGKIGVSDSARPPQKWFYRHPVLDGMEQMSSHNILPESTKQFFASRNFCCYEYKNISTAIEENMFQLVQRGIPLTPAERMRALSTRWATLGKEFEDRYSKVLSLSKQGRASSFRMVLTIFSQVLEVINPYGYKRTVREGTRPSLQSNPQTLLKFLRDNRSLNEVVQDRLKQVFEKFEHLVNLSSDPAPRSTLGFKIQAESAFDPSPKYLTGDKVNHVKTFSPLELLSTAILILHHMDSRTDEMLLADIKNMRHYLREHHKDLRLNNQCWTTTWDFIDIELVRRQGSCEAGRRQKPDGSIGSGRDKSSDADRLVMVNESERPSNGCYTFNLGIKRPSDSIGGSIAETKENESKRVKK